MLRRWESRGGGAFSDAQQLGRGGGAASLPLLLLLRRRVRSARGIQREAPAKAAARECLPTEGVGEEISGERWGLCCAIASFSNERASWHADELVRCPFSVVALVRVGPRARRMGRAVLLLLLLLTRGEGCFCCR